MQAKNWEAELVDYSPTMTLDNTGRGRRALASRDYDNDDDDDDRDRRRRLHFSLSTFHHSQPHFFMFHAFQNQGRVEP